jgi:endonuclease YncB( thermonuclease family)
MQILPSLVAAAVAVFQTSSAADRVTRSNPVLVRSVIDGNTIDVASVGRVRLLGIDAPQMGRRLDSAAPFGREARERLISLILNRWIRLEREGASRAASNRRAAYVVTDDGVFINAVLVREGLARVSARAPLVRLSELQRAEAEAKASRRGMWGAVPQIQAPSYTRRSKAGRPPTYRIKTTSHKRKTTPKKKP